MKRDALWKTLSPLHALIFFFKLNPILLPRILTYLIQMTGEIEVHEPLHSYNAEHVSEQYLRAVQKIVYSNNKDFY